MCSPCLGDAFGELSLWTPVEGRSSLFDEVLDATDPWQLKTFLVA